MEHFLYNEQNHTICSKIRKNEYGSFALLFILEIFFPIHMHTVACSNETGKNGESESKREGEEELDRENQKERERVTVK